MLKNFKNYILLIVLFLLFLLLYFFNKDKNDLQNYISILGIIVSGIIGIFQIKKNYEDNLNIEKLKEDDEIIAKIVTTNLKISEYTIHITQVNNDLYKGFKNVLNSKTTVMPYISLSTKYNKNVFDIDINFFYENEEYNESLSIQSLDSREIIILPLKLYSREKYNFYKYDEIKKMEIRYKTGLTKEIKIEEYEFILKNGAIIIKNVNTEELKIYSPGRKIRKKFTDNISNKKQYYKNKNKK